MRATRAERSAKRAMNAAAAGSSRSNLGESVAALFKAMSKKEKLHDGVEKLVVDRSALKEEVNEASIDAAMPVLLGLGIVQRVASDGDTSSPKDLWNGFSVDRITEVLASILDAHDDIIEESDHKTWALSKKVLKIFLKLPVGQGLHSIETFTQLHGEEAADRIDKAGDYGDLSAVLRILSGVKLLVKRGPFYYYRGPNVFPAWEFDQIVKYGNKTNVKICRVALETIKVPKHLFSKKARRRMRRLRRGDGSK